MTDCFSPRIDWQDVGQIRWSADGSMVYWRSRSDVFVISANGSGLHRVIDSKLTGDVKSISASNLLRLATSSFSLSPDGTQVVYSSCRFPQPSLAALDGYVLEGADYQFEIVRAATTGGALRRLTRDDSFDSFPSWSPDGARIAYLSSSYRRRAVGGADELHLFTMAPDGSGVQDLTPTIAALIQHPPQWAPDGQRLAFVAYSHDSFVTQFERRADLYTVRVDGTELRRLAPAVRSPVAWSPDGQRLAFAQSVDNAVMLVTVAADGSDLQRLVPIEGWERGRGHPQAFEAWINSVAWSPDGTRILVSVNERQPAFIVGLDSPDRREVGILRDPDGRFQGVRAAAWSPDGSQIALLGPSLVATVPADGGPTRGLAGHVGLITDKWEPRNGIELATPVHATGCGAGVAVADPTANSVLVADCAALLEVQQALADGGALNWSVDRPMSEWDGLTLGGTPLRVQALAIGDLRGPLSAALGNLTQLQALQLSGGRFTGPIPPELGRLTALRELDLSNNQLTEAIPPELGQLGNLQILDLSKNQLTGPIPSEFGQIESLSSLHLGGNRLTGCIPESLAERENDHFNSDLSSLDLPICEPAA